LTWGQKSSFFNIWRTTTLVVESNSNGPTTAWRLPCFACTFWCGWRQQLALWGRRLSIWGHFGSFITEVSVKETREGSHEILFLECSRIDKNAQANNTLSPQFPFLVYVRLEHSFFYLFTSPNLEYNPWRLHQVQKSKKQSNK
jgi:hypothetical protein